MPSSYPVSSVVERNIDGQWFHAEVVAVRSFNRGRGAYDDDDEEVLLTLKYFDDGNIEENVDPGEVRLLDKDSSPHSLAHTGAALGALPPRKKSTLPKPLAGLMEDDEDQRITHQTRVILHNEDEIGTINYCLYESHLTSN
jgi:hypothetical protein